MVPSVNLKRDIEIENGAHILYIFQSVSSYMDNLVAYVEDGLKLDHIVVLVDKIEIYQELRERLLDKFTEEDLKFVVFDPNDTFYGTHTEFQTEQIVHHFEHLLSRLLETHRTIRTWAKVVWGEDRNILTKLKEFEDTADESVKGQSVVSVCAYNESDMPGELLIKMLKNHDFFMTDTELVRSPLYKQKPVFPSLAVQSKIESEIDFYKSKLDFIHVVSHEVRNPLTIIKGYAQMVRSTEDNLRNDTVEKMTAIEQYVDSIDQELSNIIETEEMLSNDLFMMMETIHPLDVVKNVTQLMATKSMLQNIRFVTNISLPPNYSMLGNELGLRLILSNLVSNAIKYTGEQGTVKFSATVADDELRFVIRDNGIGMSVRQLNSLFRKYAKLNGNTSGQGIGLYIVKNLTDRFNGSIAFESQLGHGTTVTVGFPIHPTPIEQGRRESSSR